MINKYPVLNPSIATRQSGVVLVISLIMLLALTLIGVTSSSVTGLETKMAANSKDKNLAFQAAEAALRAAEASLILSSKDFTGARIASSIDANQGAAGLYSLLNNDELADKAPTLKTPQPLTAYYSSVDWKATSNPKYIRYDNGGGATSAGSSSSVAKLVGLYQEPRYILEELSSEPLADANTGGDMDTGGPVGSSLQKKVRIRITAHGWGSNATAIATVQSVVELIY